MNVGDRLESPISGEWIELRRLPVDPEVDVLELEHWWPMGHRTPEHVHPEMEERWLVISGSARFEIGGGVVRAGPGDRLVAPRGVAHASWNVGEEPVRVRVQMWPGLRWAEFVERLFAGEEPAALMGEFDREIALP